MAHSHHHSHNHSHSHDHKHDHHGHSHVGHGHHHHAPSQFTWAFAIAIVFNSLFMLIEAIYAIAAHSMSLLADAGHNLSDILGLLMAWGAAWLLTRPATERYSYGYKKTSIVAALANALLLVAASAIIAYESVIKLLHPVPVHEWTIIIVAFIGIFINGGTALLFMQGSKEDLNIKGAFMHLAGDALISLGVVIGGLLVLFTHWYWIDPVVGLLIVITILLGTWSLLMDSVKLILDAVPSGINVKGVEKFLSDWAGVKAVHDLHIWGLSTKEVALTAHLIMPESSLSDNDYLQINKTLKEKFRIDHVTLQVEKGNENSPCEQLTSC